MKLAVKITTSAIAAVLVACAVIAGSRTPEEVVAYTKPDEVPKTVTVIYVNSPIGIVDNVQKNLVPLDYQLKAIKENGEVLAPLSFLVDAYGGSITWNKETRTVFVKVAEQDISYTIGKAEMTVGNRVVELQTAPRIENDKTFVSVNSFANALGVEYFTDGDNMVIIGSGLSKDKATLDNLKTKFEHLPVVGTKEKFIELMAAIDTDYGVPINKAERGMEITGRIIADYEEESMSESAAAPLPRPTRGAEFDNDVAQKNESFASDSDYSTTNVQVEGVDEADIIKTDGQYIYFVKENRISVVNAANPEDMVLESTMEFIDKNFSPIDMYVDGNTLVVLGNSIRQFLVNGMLSYQSTTRAYVYDMSDHKKPEVVREFESDGNYLSSRKIGNSFYMITNSWIYKIGGSGVYPLPMYRDSVVSVSHVEIGFDKMFYFPNFINKNYLVIAGFDLDKPKEAAKVSTYLGSGQNVYASMDNLYVATMEYENITPAQKTEDSIMPSDIDISPRVAAAPVWNRSIEKTAFYKFALDNGNVQFESKQSVDGTLLNQFSMDEYNKHFRTVTTSHDYNTGEQKNALYVMDSDMKVTGKIEDIAPGERIYSARFMGDRAYMVTFKNVDPLFAIDLKDPKNPQILGALKIPGYSNYLHPYDENHLIGFGKDTMEYNGSAYDKGMKMAIFDVTDMTNPKEMFVQYIGDRGTDSPLLTNHKALLFSKERNLLAFPVSVATLTKEQKSSPNNMWEYGQFTFQGAYVYSVDLTNGFKLNGKISHMSPQDMLKAGYYGGDYEKQIQRIIYIGDNLYTASQSIIKANSLNGFKELDRVNLK